jgi:hypothetical protein
MAKLTNYTGSVELMAGITQKGGGNFPLIEANAVQVDENGTRLDEKLALFKTTDNNTTYTLTKSGSTITLTGSDGKKSSVTDSSGSANKTLTLDIGLGQDNRQIIYDGSVGKLATINPYSIGAACARTVEWVECEGHNPNGTWIWASSNTTFYVTSQDSSPVLIQMPMGGVHNCDVYLLPSQYDEYAPTWSVESDSKSCPIGMGIIGEGDYLVRIQFLDDTEYYVVYNYS